MRFLLVLLLSTAVTFAGGVGECPDPCVDPCPTSEITQLQSDVRALAGAATAAAAAASSSSTAVSPCAPYDDSMLITALGGHNSDVQGKLDSILELLAKKDVANRWYNTFGFGGGYGQEIDQDLGDGPKVAHGGLIFTPWKWLTVGASYYKTWDNEGWVNIEQCYKCEGSSEMITVPAHDSEGLMLSAWIRPFARSK